MGKRKERRFAANNTSRRVKLDLFAEPSGMFLSSYTCLIDFYEAFSIRLMLF